MQKKLRINSFVRFFCDQCEYRAYCCWSFFLQVSSDLALPIKELSLFLESQNLVFDEKAFVKKKKGKWLANSECFSNTSNTFLCLFISDLVKSWATKTTTEKWFFGQKKLGINSFVRLFVTNVSKLLLVFSQVWSDL